MTRSPVSVVLCSLALLIAIGLAGCGGTETGNPSGGGNPAVKLGGAVCDKLFDCFGKDEGFTKGDCEEAIADNEALGAAFGVEEEPPPEYGEIIDKVEVNELSANKETVDECVDAIESLVCEDPRVLAVDTQEAFRNVEQMIPEAACSQVFSGP